MRVPRQKPLRALMVAPLLCALLLLKFSPALPVRAGGPLLVGNGTTGPDGQPLLWANPAVTYTTDGGFLGTMNNAAANLRVGMMFQIWEDVPSSSVSFTRTGGIPAAQAGADLDVNSAVEFDAIFAQDCPGNPIIYDATGGILMQLGVPSGVLGVAAICDQAPGTGSIRQAFALLNGAWIDGNTANGELTLAEFDGVFVHEFGHFIGMDHSQINIECLFGFCADGSDAAFGIPTMFPFELGLSEAPGVPQSRTLAPDDIAWVSYFYPGTIFAPSTGTISGAVLYSDGLSGVQGMNVIARAVDDPMTAQDESRRNAVSVVSGWQFTGNPGNPLAGNPAGSPGSRDPGLKGAYLIPGLAPGNYTVEVEEIFSAFTGGSGVGPIGGPRGEQFFFPGVPPAPVPATAAAGISTANVDLLFILTAPTFDSFESAGSRNDTIATASVHPSGTVRGSLSPFPDEDYFSFSATAGTAVLVDLISRRPPLFTQMDPFIRIEDSNGFVVTNCRLPGAPAGAFNSLCQNDDFIPGVDRDSRLEFNAATSGTYFVRVLEFFGDARADYEYDLFVGVVPPPANDPVTGAIDLIVVPFADVRDTRTATADTGSPDPVPTCAVGAAEGGNAHSVWYKITPGTSATVIADTFGSDYDTVLAAFSGSPGAFTQVACNDESFLGFSGESQIAFSATAGTTYHIMAVSRFPGGGHLVLNVDSVPPPANDNFANAIVASPLPFNDTRDTRGATTEISDPTPSCAFGFPNSGRDASVWYRITPASAGVILVDPVGSDYGLILSVYTGTQGNLTAVQCSLSFGFLPLTFSATAGTTYHLSATSLFGAGGNLQLSFSSIPPPSNDEFASATAVNVVPFSAAQSTLGATTNTATDRAPTCFFPGAADMGRAKTVWYQFTPMMPGVLEAETTGSSYDTILAVFTGTPPNLTQVACSDDAIGLQSRVALTATAGTTYHLMISDWQGIGGDLQMSVNLVNPAPVVTTLVPPSVAPGAAAFTLTVNGSGFINSSAVFWNGSPRTTTFGSATQLTAAITAADVAAAGTATILVQNPTPGGGIATTSFLIATLGVSSVPASATVARGASAQFSISLNLNGPFTNPVTMSCSGLPSLSACQFNPAMPAPGANPVMTTLTITTTAPGAIPPATWRWPAGWRLLPLLAFFLVVLALTAFVRLAWKGTIPREAPLSPAWALLVLLVVATVQLACGGGGGGPAPLPPRPGTPPGTYMVTVTGASGGVSGSTAVTLTVQ